MKKSLSISCLIFLCVLFLVSLFAFPYASAATQWDSYYDFTGLTMEWEQPPRLLDTFPYFYFLHLIHDTGQVLPLYITYKYIYGFYWDEYGILWKGCFLLPADNPDVSMFRLYDLEDLTFAPYGSSATQFCFDQEQVKDYPSYLSSVLYAFDWDQNINVLGTWVSNMKVVSYKKLSGDSAFSGTAGTYDLQLLGAGLGAEDFEWEYYESAFQLNSFGFVSRPIIAPESPVITKDVPFVPWLEYNVGDTADTITVSAAVADGGSLAYEWYKTTWPDGDIPVTEFFSSGQTMRPDTSTVGRFSYQCKVTNSLGQFVASTLSRSIDVRVVSSGAVDPAPTDPEVPSADDIGDAVGGAIEEIIESNDAAASDQGSSFVDQIIDVIPNHSAGFLDALGGLTSSLGYLGTDCVLTIPAVVMPQIDDLVPQYTLLEEHEVHLESFFNIFPDWLVSLVQAFFTAALIVYCCIEFYSVISYILTLRGG